MKNYRNEVICPNHKLPIIKIEQRGQRLICLKCESETEAERRKRLELLRAKLNASYAMYLPPELESSTNSRPSKRTSRRQVTSFSITTWWTQSG